MTSPPQAVPTDARDTSAPRADATPDDGASTSTRLSLTQIVASALAAVSTTVLLSFFGVAGTIIGAGLASVATVIGNYLYTRSIEKTQAQLKAVATLKPGTRRTSTTTTATTRPLPAIEDAGADGGGDDADGSDAVGGDDEGVAKPRNRWLRLIDRYGKGRVLTATALALFAVVMGAVLTIELAVGKPISDVVRGQEGTGTTISTIRSAETGDSGDSGDSSDGSGSGEQNSGEGTDGETSTDQQPTQDDGAPADDPTSVPSVDPTAPATDGSDGSADDATNGSGDSSGTGTDSDSGSDSSSDSGSDTGSDSSSDTESGSGSSGSTDGSTDAGTGTGTDTQAPATGDDAAAGSSAEAVQDPPR